ncbi:MAG: hypothetical protein ACLFN1_06015, partial [Bacteroidales bacterium]
MKQHIQPLIPCPENGQPGDSRTNRTIYAWQILSSPVSYTCAATSFSTAYRKPVKVAIILFNLL